MAVADFSSKPKGSKEDIEKYKVKSEEDKILFETGVSLLQEFSKGKIYEHGDGQKIPLPIKTEGWPGDSWDDGKNSNVNRLWGRTLSDTPFYLSSMISVTKLYDLRAKNYYVRLDTRNHNFRASDVKEKGIDWIRKIVEADLSLA